MTKNAQLDKDAETGKRELFSAGLWVFGGCCDRFVPGGYSRFLSTDEQLESVSKVPGISGVEIIYPSHFRREELGRLKGRLSDLGLRAVAVNPNLWSDPVFQQGAFTAPDAAVRKTALDIAKQAADGGQELGAGRMCLWLGQDGYDYPFQADYELVWSREVEAVRALAEHAPEVKIGIEYKLKEPRNYIIMGSAAKALNLAAEVGLPNVGVTLDFGHSVLSRENPAETVCHLSRAERLFLVHANDCYGEWDDDLMVGTVHLWQSLEFFLWLDRMGYDGWISLDMTPYREDATRAAAASISAIKELRRLARQLDTSRLQEIINSHDAVRAQQLVFQLLSDCHRG